MNKVDGRVSNTCNCMVNWIIGWERKNAFMGYNWFADILSVCIGCDIGLWSNGMGMYKASDNIYISWSIWFIDKNTIVVILYVGDIWLFHPNFVKLYLPWELSILMGICYYDEYWLLKFSDKYFIQRSRKKSLGVPFFHPSRFEWLQWMSWLPKHS